MPTIDESLPLHGVRVLDLTRLLPGNLCTLVLAQLGADVVKVEDKGHGDYIREAGEPEHLVDGMSSIHHVVNRAKRSICLDLKDEGDRASFERLVADADVLVESYRPGVMSRLGYPPARLHELRPSLVIASISAFGSDGPMASRTGHDINCLAFAGLLERMGDASGPLLPPVPFGDIFGGLVPAMTIMAYLRRAEATGQGAVIDTSLAESVALLPNSITPPLLAGGQVAGRGDFKLGKGLACFGTYPCADGHVAVGAQEPVFWQVLCDVVGGLDDLRDHQEDLAAQAEIRARLAAFFAGRTRQEAVEAFGEREACVSPVLSYEEMLASDHARARGFVATSPDVPMPVLAYPAIIDGQRPAERGPAPRQGEHTAEVLAELSARSHP